MPQFPKTNTSKVTWTGGLEHWTQKGDIKLFLWEKKANPKVPHAATIFFVHSSSMDSQPTFDLTLPGRPDSSPTDWFAARGFDTWTMGNEGYGRSDKHRDINFDISNGADDLAAGSAQHLMCGQFVSMSGAKLKHVPYKGSSADTKKALFDAGEEVVPSTPEAMSQLMVKEMDRWGKVVKEAGIKLE